MLFSGSILGLMAALTPGLIIQAVQLFGVKRKIIKMIFIDFFAGNKWIANKWVRWRSQMWNFPCLRRKGDYFEPFRN